MKDDTLKGQSWINSLFKNILYIFKLILFKQYSIVQQESKIGEFRRNLPPTFKHNFTNNANQKEIYFLVS